MSVRMKILKNIVENRASFRSEQVIVSYLGKYCLSLFEKAILTLVSSCHFPRCDNAMFLFKTFFVCSLIFETELKTGQVH